MGSAPFSSRSGDDESVNWGMRSELHRGAGGGVFHDLKAIRTGTLAELVRFILMLPAEEQGDYTILKEGDHVMEVGEIRTLAARPDFPR